MFRQKSLCLFFVAMMTVFCVIASGGCGGGGGSSNSKASPNNDNNSNNNNNDSNEYSISVMSGAWTASSGSGTATGENGIFDLRMVHVNASFSNVQVNGDTATAVASTSSEWDAYQYGRYVLTSYADYTQETVNIYRIGSNRWRYTFPDGKCTVTVTITSATTANITEEGITSDGYQYTADYYVTKDDQDNSTTKYDLSTLQGIWTVSSGGGSATGNGQSFELRLNEGTLTLSNVQTQNSSDSVTADLEGIIYWHIYRNGIYIRRVGLEYTRLEMQRLSGNTWRTSNGNTTLTVTSQTTASIRDKGTVTIDDYQYQYDIVYDMAKQ